MSFFTDARRAPPTSVIKCLMVLVKFYVFYIRPKTYTHVIPHIPIVVIINSIVIICVTPVLMFIIIVASDLSSSLFWSSSSLSISALFVFAPRFPSLFFHLNSIPISFVSPSFNSISASSFPSILLVQISPASTISHPSGIVSSTFTFPSISPLFSTFILYLAISSVFFISFVGISSFVSLLFVISMFCPFNVILFSVFSTE